MNWKGWGKGRFFKFNCCCIESGRGNKRQNCTNSCLLLMSNPFFCLFLVNYSFCRKRYVYFLGENFFTNFSISVFALGVEGESYRKREKIFLNDVASVFTVAVDLETRSWLRVNLPSTRSALNKTLDFPEGDQKLCSFKQ